jgi:beta-galactosidase
MLLRDRNHPCVFLWSIGNEVTERDGRSKGAEIARMLAERVREVDPTRPVTAAICGVGGQDGRHKWQDTDVVFAALDVGGYNYQWKEYRPDHERHPQRMMIGLESTPGEALDNWTLVEKESYVLGDFVWTSLDYLGEAGIGRVVYGDKEARGLGDYPWNQANCGDGPGGFGPQSYYRLLWNVGAALHRRHYPPRWDARQNDLLGLAGSLAELDWRQRQTFKVDVYSARSVELFLNGSSMGVQPSSSAERLTASFEVPYEAGELKAVGFKGGKAAAESTVKTASAAASIRLTPDRAELNAADDDLSYVTVEILDETGMVHPAADRTIFFTLQGEGSIAAVGNANPATEESYRGNQRATYRGRALVVVKTNGNAGEIRLRAQADGLAGAEVVLTTK